MAIGQTSSISLLSCNNTGHHFPTQHAGRDVAVSLLGWRMCAHQPVLNSQKHGHFSTCLIPLPGLHWFHFAGKLIPISNSFFMLAQQRGVVQQWWLSATLHFSHTHSLCGECKTPGLDPGSGNPNYNSYRSTQAMLPRQWVICTDLHGVNQLYT